MTNYDVWACSCGRIHVSPTTDLNQVQECWKTRKTIKVCTNCGRTLISSIKMDSYGGFILSSGDMSDEIINPEDNCRVIFSKGIEVPLKSGKYADSYSCGTYYNIEELYNTGLSWFPDVKDKFPDMVSVDTKKLIREVNDPEIIESIAWYVSCIGW